MRTSIGINFSIFIFFCIFCCTLFGQTATKDIFLTAELSNKKDIGVVRVIKKGELLSSKAYDYKTQTLAVYDIEKHPSVRKIKDGIWYVTIPPKGKVTIRLKVRCTNRGFKLPKATDVTTTSFTHTDTTSMDSQFGTFQGIEFNKNIFQYNCSSNSIGEDCNTAYRNAITGVFKKSGIILDEVEIPKRITENCKDYQGLEIVNVTTSLGVPAKFFLLNAIGDEIDSGYSVYLNGHIYIDKENHALFGKY